MIMHEVEGTECAENECSGTLAYGFKSKANGWKAYCDCLECGAEYGSDYISYSQVDSEDDKHEEARKHVQHCSA
jgi:hypothetical protein